MFYKTSFLLLTISIVIPGRFATDILRQKDPKCGKNEILMNCFNPCPPQRCEDIGKQFKCPGIPPEQCQPGCRCKPNFYRDKSGVCIPASSCSTTVPKCGKNEILVDCFNPCPPQQCEDIGKQFKCPGIPPEQCQPGCRCKPNFYRNISNSCIPASHCQC